MTKLPRQPRIPRAMSSGARMMFVRSQPRSGKDDVKDDNVFTQEAEAPILGVALSASLPNLLRIALQVSDACFSINFLVVMHQSKIKRPISRTQLLRT